MTETNTQNKVCKFYNSGYLNTKEPANFFILLKSVKDLVANHPVPKDTPNPADMETSVEERIFVITNIKLPLQKMI